MKRTLADEDLRLIRIFNRPAPNVLTMLLVVIGGAFLIAGQGPGLYLIFPAIIVAFISGVLNAWYFLLPPPSSLPSRTCRPGTRTQIPTRQPATSRTDQVSAYHEMVSTG